VNDQRGQAQRARGQWTEILFFAIFRSFAMDTTLLRLIFIQNVKKGKNQPTLMSGHCWELLDENTRGQKLRLSR
jgi:hypothetical protein